MYPRRLIVTLLTILLPLALYLLGYFALLRGRTFEQVGVDPVTQRNLFVIHPDYRSDGADRLFYPAHLLDRRMRRYYWTKVLPGD
jgi:hypothetical protein